MTVPETVSALPRYRYGAVIANEIERKWQDRWEADKTFWAPNPAGSLLDDVNAERANLPGMFVLDMFPYPSGAGLHVGHPLGFIGTDVYSRFQRMNGHNVLHAMGFDSFGLPAEQYAVQTGQHPRITTEANVATYRAQLRSLGFGYDPRRGINTTDTDYYRWTQWIFLQIFNSFYDRAVDKARPIQELIHELDTGTATPDDSGVAWAQRNETDRRRYIDSKRLAYIGEAPVNWCPGLGTVLANEEVTADGRSDRGNFPVYKRPLSQWMMRITEYADRLLDDLDGLDWTESIKLMQRNWIGRSEGAEVDFGVVGHDATIRVFTTRPDTLFGATYMVLAPEHALVDVIVPEQWPHDLNAGVLDSWRGRFGANRSPKEAVDEYRMFAASKSEVERASEGREKTGVFTGAFATNPTTGEAIPVFTADYVLMGYGTGAIMSVPAQDDRDWEFANAFDLPIVRTVRPPADWPDEPFLGDGPAINSANDSVDLNGLGVSEAKHKIIDWLERNGTGERKVTFKLRDWLFSRQRYWGEPFPIIHDEHGPIAVPADLLPVELPAMSNFEPTTSDDPDTLPAPPLARAAEWAIVELDLGDGPKQYRRELNTMPQWAGSCWYYLRYLDPTNHDAMLDRGTENYWTSGEDKLGTVDLYVGGVEHAVLHLLYSRFWHKVLFDLGHVNTKEPFGRLFNQGYIQAYAFTDERGMYVEASQVAERDGKFFYNDEPVNREYGKIGKSLKNVVTPDEMCAEFGADTFRMYEMFMGPLDASRPWQTRDVVGVHRFLQRLWRNCVDEETGVGRVADVEPSIELVGLLHRTIEAVREDYASLSFNTAIARLFELNNALSREIDATHESPRSVVETTLLMLAPLAPHFCEELWHRLGHEESLAYEPFPVADPALSVQTTIEIPVQINGKVRGAIQIAADASNEAIEQAARAQQKVAAALADAQVRKVIVVPGRTINFVVS